MKWNWKLEYNELAFLLPVVSIQQYNLFSNLSLQHEQYFSYIEWYLFTF